MSDALSQELLDRAAIKELKARYFRLVDAKDWEAWREVFTDDVRVRLPDLEPFVGADTWVAFVAEGMAATQSAHHGHMPELTLDGPTEAHGLWSLADYVEWPPDPETGERRGQKGYGRYTESLPQGRRRVEDRDHADRLPAGRSVLPEPLPEPLPERVLGGPPILEQEGAMP